MQESKKVRLLLLMVFLLSAVSSACMGFVAYQLATGELPFDIETYYKFRDDPPVKVEVEEVLSAVVPLRDNKIDEATVQREYKLFYEQRVKLVEKEKKLNNIQNLIDAQIQLAEKMDKDTMDKLTMIKAEREDKTIADEIAEKTLRQLEKDIKDQKIVQDEKISRTIATTLSEMKPVTAMVLISDLDTVLSAKLLNLMEATRRSEILAEMIQATTIAGYPDPLPTSTRVQLRKKANEIILELRNIKEDPNL